MKRLFVDTRAWYAYANVSDADHAPVRDLLQTFDGRLVTTNFVFDETISLVLYRRSHEAARRIGTLLQDPEVVDLLRLVSADERRPGSCSLTGPTKPIAIPTVPPLSLCAGSS